MRHKAKAKIRHKYKAKINSRSKGESVMNLTFGLMTHDSYLCIVHVGDSYLDDSYCMIGDD